jgi:Protein of unknown function (DUF3144)
MATTFDDAFYARADGHIHMSNDQINAGAAPEMVNASMLFASARFCAWLSARGFGSGEAMAAGKKEIADYFVDGFRQMLEGNLDVYVRNFDVYMKPADNV